MKTGTIYITKSLNLYWLFKMTLLAVFTGITLNAFITPVLQHNHLHTGVMQETAVVAGQVFFQALALVVLRKKNLLVYLEQMMIISAIGALLVLPAILVYQTAGFNFLYALAWFAAVVGIMFLLHLRRCKKLGLGLEVSASWVLYRIIVLVILFCWS